jgi:hypothetical protein
MIKNQGNNNFTAIIDLLWIIYVNDKEKILLEVAEGMILVPLKNLMSMVG